ncbi:hypothetical protein AYI69_g3744 [Smittium culicis]|uniref:Uncharacterized protein n=1 Tax=Smittium culicis TaxID=133412 RepID=A0A1R1YIW0_9FUNG|nr:hypothetical protein AYI69_g3744 [Smittium culicis]
MASNLLFLRGVLEVRLRYGGEILGMIRVRSSFLKMDLNNGWAISGWNLRFHLCMRVLAMPELENTRNSRIFRRPTDFCLRIGLMGHGEKSPMTD